MLVEDLEDLGNLSLDGVSFRLIYVVRS